MPIKWVDEWDILNFLHITNKYNHNNRQKILKMAKSMKFLNTRAKHIQIHKKNCSQRHRVLNKIKNFPAFPI